MQPTAHILFYAYPSKPGHIVETIEELADRINSVDDSVEVATWKSLRNSGRALFDPIEEQITQCSAFCCDLTYLNDNVLFELGYAIALNKPIFISLNTSVEGSKEKYARFRLLENVGYSGYANQHDLHNKLFHETPWSPTRDRDLAESAKQNRIFYAKLPVATDASNAVDTLITGVRNASIEIRTDDQQEAPFQSLDWYKD